jgi:membrane protease YdiL (CAAX protease family)
MSNRRQFLLVVLFSEGGLAVVALVVGWLVGFSPWFEASDSSPLAERLSRDLLWGVAAAAPAIAILFWDEPDGWNVLQGLKGDVQGILRHYLTGASHAELLFIAILAGVGEELLFRGFLQAGLARLLPAGFGIPGSLLIASLIFGACHYLSHTYFIMATIAGLYFGLLMLVSGSLGPPIIAHALYDYVALAYLLSEE